MKKITLDTIARSASTECLKATVVAATTIEEVKDGAGRVVRDKSGKPEVRVVVRGVYANTALRELKRRLGYLRPCKHKEVRDAA